MKLLSIDPGVERTGFAFFECIIKQEPTLVESGTIQTSRLNTHQKRLYQLEIKLKKILDYHKPDVLVLEQLFFFKNEKTVIQVAQSQGIILTAAEKRKIPSVFLTPLQIKSAVTGYGRADKGAIKKMLGMLLQINLKNKLDDEIDAIACGYAYSLNLRQSFR